MEFIAEDPVHVVVASERPAIYDDRGRMLHPKKRRIWAKFTRGIAPEYAQKVALETFSFRKIHEGVEPARWFGYYNSRDSQAAEGWTDEEHDLIVAKLTEAGYRIVAPEKLAAPWPAYDKLVAHGQRKIEHVVEKILAKIAEDGYDPAGVAAYERQNLNRPQVVAALEALLAPIEEEAEPLVAA